jgi:hypothetical protein
MWLIALCVRRFLARVLTLLVVVGLLAPAGCSRLDLRGDGFRDDWSKTAQRLRPPPDEKNFSGIDARSREIERNLGVR